MKEVKKLKSFISISIFLGMILFCFSACSMRAEQNSLTSQLEIIDALISQNQMQSAIKELKKVEKRAYDSWSYIGIYKRFILIGEQNLAEKIIKKALKKNKQNQELLAVYTNFLLRQNRLEDAGKYAEKLRNGNYASLYSELVLRESQKQVTDQGAYAFYQNEDFYQIYLDAYKGSKNPIWLRNCAVYNLTQGLYNQASLLNPPAYADVDDAYFWGLCLYDAGKYNFAIEALEKAHKYYSDYDNKKQFKCNEIQIVALESDAYMAVSDFEQADLVRSCVVNNIDTVFADIKDDALLPIIMVNSAIYAKNQMSEDYFADLLFYIVNRWPDYVPALILYSDFAYTSNLEKKEDDEVAALRRAGIKSLEMEKYDNRRKIPLSDALYRIDQSLKRKADPYLSITKLDLKYKTDPKLSEKDKYRDLWVLLEDNYIEGEIYHTLLVQYALNFLLTTKEYDDAWNLFYKFTTSHGTYDVKRDFWEQFIEQMKYYDLPIVEMAAWFASDLKKTNEAIRIYEYCVYESAGLLEDGLISPLVSSASCMNLANIYFSIGKKDRALDLYGKIAGREVNNAKRSEIFYRIACIYSALGDIKNALRSSEYASSLYPENERASVLKDKLRAKK
ncbi:MAG: hypothetical protein MR424_03105 [Treponema sp.]|nr:hypothetical protein [Treponema sp.]MCI6891258.1 hypothetical protein [Treponema sp.]